MLLEAAFHKNALDITPTLYRETFVALPLGVTTAVRLDRGRARNNGRGIGGRNDCVADKILPPWIVY